MKNKSQGFAVVGIFLLIILLVGLGTTVYLFKTNFFDTRSKASTAEAFPKDGLVSFYSVGSYSGSPVQVSDSNLITGDGPMTISVWFNTLASKNMNDYQMIFSYGQDGPAKKLFIGTGNDANVQPANSLFVSLWGKSLSSNGAINDGQWHQGVFTYSGKQNGNSWNLYVDGIWKNMTTTMDTNIVKTGQAFIGKGNVGTNPYNWNGQIGSIGVWSRVLTTTEIITVYKGGQSFNPNSPTPTPTPTSTPGTMVGNNLANINDSYSIVAGKTLSIKPLCGDSLQTVGTTQSTRNGAMSRSFNGTSDRIIGSAVNIPNGSNPVTISMWLRSAQNLSLNQYNVALFYGTQEVNKAIYFGIGNDSNVKSGGLMVSQHGDALDSGARINDGLWHHTAATFDGSIWRIYLDGKLKNSKVMATNIGLTTSSNIIIGGAPNNTLSWKGDIDDVHIYDRKLTDQEIVLDQNQRSVNGLVHNWTFEQSDFQNSSGNYSYNPSNYVFTPTFADGGTIKDLKITCKNLSTNQISEKNVKILVFRDYSKLIKYSGNPIIDIKTAPYNQLGADAPYIHDYQQINGVYYAPVQVNDVVASQFSWFNKIAIYTSTDLLKWTPILENPVISNDLGRWDDHFLLHPSIIKIGTLWFMYYSALGPDVSIFPPYNNLWGPESIGLATSPDLIHWTKYAKNPILTNAGIPSVLAIGNKFYLYFHDRKTDGTKVAQSSDGYNWSDQKLVLAASPGDWDSKEMLLSPSFYETGMDPFVIKNKNGFYEMVYAINYSGTQKCGTALSQDGLNWYKYQGAILNPSGISGSYDKNYVGDCVPLDLGNKFYLYYAAVPASGYKGVNFDVGLGSLGILQP